LTFKFKELANKSELDISHRDLLLSFGEQLSSLLFQLTLKEEFAGLREVSLVPAPAFLKTDSSFGLAKPKPESIKLYAEGLLREGLSKGVLFVTQGFIGSDESEQITTLGREGSDYSATLLAEALGAMEVHIWTDVNGIFTTDPNIVKEATPLQEITYDHATALAKAGAKVLFSKTLAPLRHSNIPLKVGKTTDPNGNGTWIRAEAKMKYPLLGITVKERSDGLIITIVGDEVANLEVEQSEIDRGDNFRSFFQPDGDATESLILWYRRYF
jgi:aspartate kinase